MPRSKLCMLHLLLLLTSMIHPMTDPVFAEEEALSDQANPQESNPAESGPRPLSVEDLWAMERVGAPALSPNGAWVAFTLSVYDVEANKGNTDLWLVPADGSAAPRRLTWNEGSDGSPVWSPDSGSLVFVSKRGENPPQLYRLPMTGGEAEPLTELPMGVGRPRWLPDGRGLVFAAKTYPDLNDDFEKLAERAQKRKDDETKAKITESRLLRYWDKYRTDGRVDHLFLLDLETRQVRDLMPGYGGLTGFGSFSWDLSPDGKEAAFAANATEPPFTKLDFNIFLLDLESGEIRGITAENPASDSSPYYTPDGRFLLFGRNHRPEISPDFTRLARYDRSSGEIRELTADWDGQPSDWRAVGDRVLFRAQARGRRHLYAMSLTGGEPEVIAQGGNITGLATGPSGRIVFSRESFHTPAELFALESTAGGDPVQITHINQHRLAAIDFGTVEDVTFTGAEDEEAQMFVLYPPGFDRTKKWPLLMLVHGGPHGAWLDSFHYRWNAALFASPGYVVAALNFHGSTGFGQAYAESILGAHAEKPFVDVMRATDHLLATGYIDEKRLAAAGGSYGGYLVSWILGHTDRFAALVNHAGVYDLMAQFASDYTWSRSNNYGASPWEDPARIDRWSPSRYAKNFSTPTLILHGELDYRVPYTQGVNLHGVLTGKGVPSRIVIFPKENHWIQKPQAAGLWWGEVFHWLERHIGKGAS